MNKTNHQLIPAMILKGQYHRVFWCHKRRVTYRFYHVLELNNDINHFAPMWIVWITCSLVKVMLTLAVQIWFLQATCKHTFFQVLTLEYWDRACIWVQGLVHQYGHHYIALFWNTTILWHYVKMLCGVLSVRPNTYWSSKSRGFNKSRLPAVYRRL